ncbi:MAG: CBM35 domain-containing protein, partial [Bacteroidota bacterium]|nr:CBM35 domain-containing protein [Bacteroidota bacterium]
MQKALSILAILLLIASGSFSQKFEAESATLSGGAIKTALASASGSFIVEQKEGNLTFNINFVEAATYNVYIQVASPSGYKANNLLVDGTSITFATNQNSSYVKLKVVSFLKLAAGAHKIEITKSWGWINIDYIEFEKVDPSTMFNINTTLVTPNPTDETLRLYQFLYDNYRKKIISGVMDMADVNWLKTNTGKSPALVGLDFMQTNRGYSWYNDNTPYQEAKAFYDKNGIPILCWHWRDPSRKTDAFYTKDTSFDI